MSRIQKLREMWKRRRLRRTVGVARVTGAEDQNSTNSTHPPMIDTPWGEVTEGARLQAALNMKASPDVKKRVEDLLISKMGPFSGMDEARRRYPEAYEGE